MSTHCFSEIFLHFNWHCQENRPLIRPEIEPKVHAFLRSYCADQHGVYYKLSGGTDDHVHLLVQIEPEVLISDFVGKIKGASSFELNKQLGKGTIYWQRGYGVVSFAEKNLPGLISYVSKQKEHHAKGALKPKLEIYDSHFEKEG
jgi:putative transposase